MGNLIKNVYIFTPITLFATIIIDLIIPVKHELKQTFNTQHFFYILVNY